MIARYRSWPAVSHTCASMVLPSCSICRVAKSTPIVPLESWWNSSRVNRLSKPDLPTPESPCAWPEPPVRLVRRARAQRCE